MLQVYGPRPEDITHRQLLDFLAIRKAKFVDELHWNIPHTITHEWDQYDLPDAQFVVAYENGRCVGGTRIIKTTTETVEFFGMVRSWMIADFHNRETGGLSNAKTDPMTIAGHSDVWEMTRFVANNPSTTAAILAQTNQYLADVGAKHVLTLSPKLMARVLRRLGYETQVVSDDLVFDNKPFVILRTDVKHPTVSRRIQEA